MRRRVLALLPLATALFIEWAAPGIVGEYRWSLFYPAAFLSSWVGGRWMGLLGTLLTTALVWWLFIPPEHALLKPLHELAPAAVFCTMGFFFAVFHDRLRAANATLRKLVDERRVFAALIENSSDFIGIADASGKPVYVNPAGRRMVGMSPDFPVGETQIPEYYPPEQRQFVNDVIVKTMIERGHWQGETYFRNWQTQEPIPVSDEHFMIREPETGRVLGAGTVTRDITDLKRARDEIEAANRKLKELDELKTRFFANVSHELRTPLALILGPVRTLLESPATSSDARRDLEVIERNALTLLRHVNDLLDVAKLEAGAMKLDYAETDVARMVRFVAGHFEAISSEKSVAWTTEAPASLNAQLDPEKLQRILFNLMSNACKFTPGGGRIRVTLRDEGADRLAIEVADSGPGIPADKRELVFERFSQLDEGATRRFGGTGLGLAIVRELTALHFGRVSIAEAPEGGASFVVEMPRRAPAGAAVRPAELSAVPMDLPVRAASAAPAAQQQVDRDAPLVLVVEDNPEMNHYVAAGLSDRFRVATAFDGRAGIDKALELHPDIVLTDLMMPGVSGEALVRELRAHHELDATPIVVLTARADDELRVRLLEHGVTDYLVKPFALEELRARVSNLVSRKVAEERLERALRARDEVLGVVAHDLRSPLNAIMLHSTLMRRAKVPERRDLARVDAIRRAAARMNRLIQDLLDVARLEAGRALAIHRGPLDPAAVVREVLASHHAAAASASLELTADVRECTEIFADHGRLLQIFDNLIGNAIKFTPAHGRITLGAQSNGGEVVFYVADTGTGLPPEVAAHMFNRFWQGEAADKRGAGLGLSVTKAIVEGHGGRIWVESKPGHGTRVYFTIPRAASSAVAV